MQYTTTQVMNLMTGQPFVFDVPDKKIARMKEFQKRVESNEHFCLAQYQNVEDFTKSYEFSFFPAYKEVLRIFLYNGYTDELIAQILSEFGLEDSFIKKLTEDKSFVRNVKPWFTGITNDGERAVRTLGVVYDVAKQYFSLATQRGDSDTDFISSNFA